MRCLVPTKDSRGSVVLDAQARFLYLSCEKNRGLITSPHPPKAHVEVEEKCMLNPNSGLLVFRSFVLGFVVTFFIAGCNSGDNNASDATSFLDGGTYGRLTLTSVSPEDIKGLPFIGYTQSFTLTSQQYAANQPFFPYGGIQTIIDNPAGIYGNSIYDTPLRLIYQVFFNPDSALLQDGTTVPLYVVAQDGNSTYCIDKNDTTGSLRQFSVSTLDACISRPIAEMVVSKASTTGLELDLDMGNMPTRHQLEFFLATEINGENLMPITGVAVTNPGDRFPSTYLNQHQTESSILPNNMIENGHGAFLPNPDGFGFTNAPDNDYRAIKDNDMARMWGKNTVCFDPDSDTCTLNAFGEFVDMSYSGNFIKGSCYGYAMASMMLHKGVPYKGRSVPSDYVPGSSASINLPKNSDIANLIGVKFNNQHSHTVYAYQNIVCSQMTAMDTIHAIRQGFMDGDPIAVLNISKINNANDVEGHAITPYAITKEDDETYRIYVYDNNYPGNANRFVEVNAADNHWKYYASINSGAPTDLYEGIGLSNPMCPIPLSMQENMEIVHQEVNTTYIFNFFASNTNAINSAFMKLNIKTPQGFKSGYDFAAGKNVNNIPNSTEDDSGFSGYQPSYTIADPLPMNNLPLITDIQTLNTYLAESYTITSAAAGKLFSDTSITAFLQTTVTNNQVNGIMVKQLYDPSFSFSYRYRIHPSARIVALDNPSKGASILLTMNEQVQNVGYAYSLTLTEDIEENTSVGALIADDGTLEVFLFNDTALQRVETGFEIIAEVIKSR